MGRSLLAALLVAFALVGDHARADGDARRTITFPYRQKKLLYSRNGPGGLAYVTPGASRGATLPVVVFLHGLNPDAQVHMWFGPPHGDLRGTVDALVASGQVAPFVLAAPTHTRFATGARVMWPDFDLADFLDATQAALGESARLDRARVIVVGHSAAGCNPAGGILSKSIARAKAVLAVDTCVDEPTAGALASLAKETSVRFYWQPRWQRPVEELADACPACKFERVPDLGPLGHDAILPATLRRALPELLPLALEPEHGG